jgi:hypothetical protein
MAKSISNYELIHAEHSKKIIMIEGKNIICISQTTWHGEFTKSIDGTIVVAFSRKNTIVL